MTPYTGIEREAVVLQITVETINAMVNHEVLGFSRDASAMQVSFKSLSQQALFNVLLADLMEPVDEKLLGRRESLLATLSNVVATPLLGNAAEARGLQDAVAALVSWLEEEITVDIWLPSIDADVILKLRRKEFIAICGNVAKHNPSRLTRKAERLQKLLEAAGVTIGPRDALRALGDFHDRFHRDILIYHATYLAQLLNDIRWGIHEYLQSVYQSAYVPPMPGAGTHYSFRYPNGLDDPFARDRFWELMNGVRSGPWIQRFTADPVLRVRY